MNNMHILLEYNHALFDEQQHIGAGILGEQALTGYFQCDSIQIELALVEIKYRWTIGDGLDLKKSWPTSDKNRIPILNI